MPKPQWPARLPFFYGWVLVAAAFITMGIGVNVRTAFSLFFSPILSEYEWDRGLVAGAFSFGFIASAVLTPLLGRLVDARGPRIMIALGVALMGTGLVLASFISKPWHLYMTLGLLVSSGSICLGYTGHSLFLPNWFIRRRGLALSLAFSGVGVGSILLLPWLQALIERSGWRSACMVLGVMVLLLLMPLTLLLKRSPEEIGLAPDGVDSRNRQPGADSSNIVNADWAAVDWTLPRAIRTGRYWWIASGYFCGLFAWYAVQVHQTKYLIEIGFDPMLAAWALGFVSLGAIPGQILLGHLSDRIGREWVWSAGCLGFAICYAALLLLRATPISPLLYLMVGAQGFLGYGLTSVLGAIPAEIFQGKHYGAIFGTLMLSSLAGGATGPWVAGMIHDATGSYALAFIMALGFCGLSALSIWMASPRKIRTVAGRTPGL